MKRQGRSESFGKRGSSTPIGASLAHTSPARYLKKQETTKSQAKKAGKEAANAAFGRSNGNGAARKAKPSGGKGAGDNSSRKAGSTDLFVSMRETSDHALVNSLREKVLPPIMERIDTKAAAELTKEELLEELDPVVRSVLEEQKILLNNSEHRALRALLVDEMMGFGPLEPLLADPSINDILVNGAHQVYVERKGKLERTNVTFRDDSHVFHVANRICNRVGRRVDISNPMADARLPDGSRVNVVCPPLALRGPSISIRKFTKDKMALEDMVDRGSLSREMAMFLQIATLARLNVVVSGGTGSGKTTMLNALSQHIDIGDRVVTIEDAAELQLRQPHVVPLETRPRNLDGEGEVTIRDLLINSLRMRPDRIILGEVRGKECFDMLQAFNTGHDGGMCTVHANSPGDALIRMENLVLMSGVAFPLVAIRRQIAEAVDLIVQVKRMRDGGRRTVKIVEIVGMEGDVITSQPLFEFQYKDDDADGKIRGDFVPTGMTPHCMGRLKEAGLETAAKRIFA